MANIGFHLNEPSNQGNNTPNSMEEIEKILQTETYQLNNYENQLRQQIKAVEDLQHNFIHTEKLVESIEKLMHHRESIITKIRFLNSKRSQEKDVEKIQSLLQMMSRLDSEISSGVIRANQETQKLIVEETHLLYAATKETKAIMDRINEEARNIIITLKTIEARFNGPNPELQQINQTVARIKQERLQEQAAKKTVVNGF